MSFNYSPKIITESLMLYVDVANNRSYPGSGTNLLDLSKNGNSGILNGGASYNSLNLGSIEFDGASGCVDLGSSINAYLTDSAPFTLEVYCYLTPNGADQAILSNTWTDPGVHLRMKSDGRIRFIGVTNGGVYAGWDSSSIMGGWYHLIGTYLGGGCTTSSMKLYVNGILQDTNGVASGSVSTITSPNNLFIGKSGSVSFDAFLNGKVSIARVYNKEFSASDVLKNFNALKGRYGI